MSAETNAIKRIVFILYQEAYEMMVKENHSPEAEAACFHCLSLAQEELITALEGRIKALEERIEQCEEQGDTCPKGGCCPCDRNYITFDHGAQCNCAICASSRRKRTDINV